ncbi:transketolase [Candidatus Peregrinibacteria bacterium]|jgi:transketolase|nr:transketolase [Candidatus Peregrinibacteria bacterium]
MDLQKLSNSLRQDILKMVYAAQSGHPGGSFSVIDILTALYFGGFIHYNTKDVKSQERDYVILSKGHASPAIYAVLAEAGFFSKDEFFSFRQIDSKLQGHPTIKTPGVEVSTGSLGQGLSIAHGIALGKTDKKVFAILGDGELQEGNCWEAAMSAAHYKTDNLIAIIDRNNLQIDGNTEDVMAVGNAVEKFQSFNWEVFEIDGHNFQQIEDTLNKAIAVKGKPAVIIANTVKGKGVSFMENQAGWHGKAPNEKQFEEAMKELQSL